MIQPPSTSRVNAAVTALYRPRPRLEYAVLPSSARKLRKLVLKKVFRLLATTSRWAYGQHTATNVLGRNTRVTVAMTRISVLSRRVRIATFLESSARCRGSSAIRIEISAVLSTAPHSDTKHLVGLESSPVELHRSIYHGSVVPFSY
jgi:hypothetical protein